MSPLVIISGAEKIGITC